jgi:hypothetical protein
MARQPQPSPAENIADKIMALRSELRERRQEVKDLDAKAAQLAGSDPEASISANTRARSVERYIRGRETALVDLIRQAHAQQAAEHFALIDALVERKKAEAHELAEQLNAACAEVNAAALKLARIGTPNRNVGLSGTELFSWQPTTSGHPFESTIRDRLGFRIASLERAAGDLRIHAAEKSFYPANISDGICFSELRSELPDLHLEDFTEVPDFEPVAVSEGFGTH